MKTERVYMYSRYERIWHWLQAVMILVLFVTGLEIHAPENFGLLSFETSVNIHRVLGFILIANAFLGLFYHLATGEIKQYFASKEDLLTQALSQAAYYFYGIFHGAPHPFEKRPGAKLNPLQKFTYVVILNLLLPLQVLSGILMWGAQRWGETADRLGGLFVLGAVHSTVAWLFAAFIVLHVYLTTTGRTPASHIRAMIGGWEEIEKESAGGPNA